MGAEQWRGGKSISIPVQNSGQSEKRCLEVSPVPVVGTGWSCGCIQKILIICENLVQNWNWVLRRLVPVRIFLLLLTPILALRVGTKLSFSQDAVRNISSPRQINGSVRRRCCVGICLFGFLGFFSWHRCISSASRWEIPSSGDSGQQGAGAERGAAAARARLVGAGGLGSCGCPSPAVPRVYGAGQPVLVGVSSPRWALGICQVPSSARQSMLRFYKTMLCRLLCWFSSVSEHL